MKLPRLILWSLVVLVGCDETVQERYATVAEARAAGFFARGWAPDVLPDRAGPVTEAHDLDTNARCMRATFHPDSFAVVRSALARTGFITHSGTVQGPRFGRCPISESEVEAAQLTLRQDRQQAGIEYVALHAEGVLYYWSAGDASPRPYAEAGQKEKATSY